MAKTCKVATLDKNFSLALRESYDNTCAYPDCQYCGNQPGGADDCSHYYGRRYRGGRWYPDNCVALCRGVHAFVDGHKAIHVDFMRLHLGRTRHDALVERLQDNHHITAVDRYKMNQHFIAERKRIQELRLQGWTGYISLAAYD